MKQVALSHEFVDEIPSAIEEGRLYVSIRYRTAVHLCACGCGAKVVTPIKPPKWHLTFDGETVSLWPSIGSWQLPCRSHYWIRRSRISWAKPWTAEEISEGRSEDAADLRRYYSERTDAAPARDQSLDAKRQSAAPTRGLRLRIRGLLRREVSG